MEAPYEPAGRPCTARGPIRLPRGRRRVPILDYHGPGLEPAAESMGPKTRWACLALAWAIVLAALPMPGLPATTFLVGGGRGEPVPVWRCYAFLAFDAFPLGVLVGAPVLLSTAALVLSPALLARRLRGTGRWHERCLTAMLLVPLVPAALSGGGDDPLYGNLVVALGHTLAYVAIVQRAQGRGRADVAHRDGRDH